MPKHSSSSPILPGSTIGMLGGGQLGRMFCFVARRMGYKVIIVDPHPKPPAAFLADKHIQSEYDDPAKVLTLAEECSVITYEFENVDTDIARSLNTTLPVYPGPHVLAFAQHRLREKECFAKNGFSVAPFWGISAAEDLEQAAQKIGFPAFLKTSRFGYDGKGQWAINTLAEAQAVWEKVAPTELIWEKKIEFEKEISVVISRSSTGESVAYDITENIHRDNILDVSIAPANVPPEVSQKAQQIGMKLALQEDIVGTFALEMFLLKNGEILLNEIAPRPHNSGHHTIEGCAASQFENQLRAICGLPLGSTTLRSPVVMMVNILGDERPLKDFCWVNELLKDPNLSFHWYEKEEWKNKRKMGHITVFAVTYTEALEKLVRIKQCLLQRNT